MTAVHVVVPEGIDDPARPSGGNVYDRRICRELVRRGWAVHERALPGPWPRADPASRAELARVLGAVPDGAVVLIDGLVASTMPEVLSPVTSRLRLVVLVHMPLGDGRPGEDIADVRARECAVLCSAAAVVTTSSWTRRRLLDLYALPPDRVHVAEPGVDVADPAPGTVAGGEFVCVAAVTPHKGHDLLLTALATLADLPWHCRCVGSLHRDPGFADDLGRQAHRDGVGDRVLFTGPLTGVELDGAYAAADLLVLASRGETYGMVVTEALARGLPVVATAVGGLPDALGHSPDGSRPGLLVPPGDSPALAAALRRWLGDQGLRQRLRHSARQRRETLLGWSASSERIASVLSQAAA